MAGDWLYGKKTKYTVFNNAIELDKFVYNEQIRNRIRKQYHIEDKYVIGHVGRFCYQKNHDFLIDIFEKVHEREKDSVLLLIGEGELEDEIKAKVHRLGLDECVIFAGTCNNVNEMYQAMDVFVLPSRYEGLPVVGVEAQAAGVPCLFSSNITSEILMSKNAMQIQDNIKDWINIIMQYTKFEKDSVSNLKKFDILTIANDLQNRYMEFEK